MNGAARALEGWDPGALLLDPAVQGMGLVHGLRVEWRRVLLEQQLDARAGCQELLDLGGSAKEVDTVDLEDPIA